MANSFGWVDTVLCDRAPAAVLRAGALCVVRVAVHGPISGPVGADVAPEVVREMFVVHVQNGLGEVEADDCRLASESNTPQIL